MSGTWNNPAPVDYSDYTTSDAGQELINESTTQNFGHNVFGTTGTTTTTAKILTAPQPTSPAAANAVHGGENPSNRGSSNQLTYECQVKFIGNVQMPAMAAHDCLADPCNLDTATNPVTVGMIQQCYSNCLIPPGAPALRVGNRIKVIVPAGDCMHNAQSCTFVELLDTSDTSAEYINAAVDCSNITNLDWANASSELTDVIYSDSPTPGGTPENYASCKAKTAPTGHGGVSARTRNRREVSSGTSRARVLSTGRVTDKVEAAAANRGLLLEHYPAEKGQAVLYALPVTEGKWTSQWTTTRALWIDGKCVIRAHKGIDIASSAATARIFAVYGGTIIEIQRDIPPDQNLDNGGTGYGNYVKIEHDLAGTSLAGGDTKLITVYAHLKEVKSWLKKDVRVGMGQCIGLMGDTGHSIGQHLHFELYVNSNRVDPIQALGWDSMEWTRDPTSKEWTGVAENQRLPGRDGDRPGGAVATDLETWNTRPPRWWTTRPGAPPEPAAPAAPAASSGPLGPSQEG